MTVRIKPIPKRMLIHQVDYYERIEGGRYDGGYADKLTITNVLFQPDGTVAKTGDNEEKLIKGILYLDAQNSSQCFGMIAQSQVKLISDDGVEETLVVQHSQPVYAFKLHHYEVQLV